MLSRFSLPIDRREVSAGSKFQSDSRVEQLLFQFDYLQAFLVKVGLGLEIPEYVRCALVRCFLGDLDQVFENGQGRFGRSDLTVERLNVSDRCRNVGMRFKHPSRILVEEFLTSRRFDRDISLIPVEDREINRDPESGRMNVGRIAAVRVKAEY